MVELGVFALLVIAFGLVSGRLQGTPITPPMVFVAVGLIAAAAGGVDFGLLVEETPGSSGEGAQITIGSLLLTAAEIALALVLFTDAARIELRTLRRNATIPGRLLAIGLPLTIALGGVVAYLLFDAELIFWEAFILAAVLAPTDAALGSSVVTNPRLPVRIRQALNVESGLNDGLAVPLFTIFVALAVAEEEVTAASAGQIILEKIGLGLAVGAAVGAVGGWLLVRSMSRGWTTGVFQQLTVAAMAVSAWWIAEEVGGSGFIAAFVGGIATGALVRGVGLAVVDFTEDIGQLLNLFIFYAFGAVAYQLLELTTWKAVVYAVLMLTVLRMLPVAISLARHDLQARTVLFLGWFGPRGLASIILAFIVVAEEPELTGLETIVVAMALTVLLSVFAHGLSAAPLVNRYADWSEGMHEEAPEMQEVPELPTRLGMVEEETSSPG